MARIWMGVGSSKPLRVSAASTGSEKPKSAKVGEAIGILKKREKWSRGIRFDYGEPVPRDGSTIQRRDHPRPYRTVKGMPKPLPGKAEILYMTARDHTTAGTDWRNMMKTFAIQSTERTPSVLELVGEQEDGYVVRIVRHRDDWDDVSEEFMTRELFDTCMRTGYIYEMSA